MRQEDTVRMGEACEPLSRFRIASASRLDDALAVMRRRNPEVFSISSSVGPDTCEFVVNDSRFAQIGVTFLSYRRQVLVQAHELTDLNIVWTTTGKGLLNSGSHSLPVSRSHAAVVAPHQEYAFNYAEDTDRIAFVIGAGVLEKYLAAALGMVPRGRLTLDPTLDLSIGPGAALARLMNFILTELDRSDAILGNPGAAVGLQDIIAAVVLREHPHSHLQYFQSSARTAVPSVVRRVEEYLEAQATEAVSMADLPLIAGVGIRAIQATFRKHRGYSPQEFLKSVRLKGANERLRSGKATRVIDVAYDCGFAKLSSFSADYMRRFGELPSVTLRRARGGRVAG
jgi:AraC-like DNA-binding protein